MGSGLQEILLLVLVIAIVLYLPKLRGTRPERRVTGSVQSLGGRLRLAIMASLCWAALIAVLLEPWRAGWLRFFYFGVGPIAVSWGISWVVTGYRKGGK
jgi:hypothetical protein